MAVEQFITNFVYQHNEISLEGIGTIALTEAAPDTTYMEKNKLMPVNNLEFHYKPSVKTTPEFITYYSELRGKIFPIAENDVHAYLNTMIQLLNIGNPVEIKGLGTISKQKNGTLVMTPGYYVPMLTESAFARKIGERLSEQPAEVREYHKQEKVRKTGINWLTYLILGLLIAGLLFAAYWFFLRGDSAADTQQLNTEDTLVTQQQATPLDMNQLSDSAAGFAPITDSAMVVNWKAIFREESGITQAQQVMRTYTRTSSPVQMETSDSMTFRFFVPLQSNIADTARKRDSVSRFFLRPVRLERTQ